MKKQHMTAEELIKQSGVDRSVNQIYQDLQNSFSTDTSKQDDRIIAMLVKNFGKEIDPANMKKYAWQLVKRLIVSGLPRLCLLLSGPLAFALHPHYMYYIRTDPDIPQQAAFCVGVGILWWCIVILRIWGPRHEAAMKAKGIYAVEEMAFEDWIGALPGLMFWMLGPCIALLASCLGHPVLGRWIGSVLSIIQLIWVSRFVEILKAFPLLQQYPAAVERRNRRRDREQNEEAITHVEMVDIQQEYLRGISKIREEFIGDGTPLCRARQEMLDRQAEVAKQSERLSARFKRRETDPDELKLYEFASKVLRGRREKIEKSLDRINTVYAKIEAFFTECHVKVKSLDDSLENAIFIQEIVAGQEKDDQVIRRADAAVQSVMCELGKSLIQLHHAMTQHCLPESNSEEDFNQYLDQIDRAASKVAYIQLVADGTLKPSQIH